MGWTFFNNKSRINALAQGINVAAGALVVIDYLTNPEANVAIHGASLCLNVMTAFVLNSEYGLGQLGGMLANIAYSGVVYGQAVSKCGDLASTALVAEGAAVATNIATLFFNLGQHHAQKQVQVNPANTITANL